MPDSTISPMDVSFHTHQIGMDVICEATHLPTGLRASTSLLGLLRAGAADALTLTVAGPPPEPRYTRIADAIRNVCEVAGVDLALADIEHGLIPDPYLRLARMLDQAGLIDWAAFTEGDR